MERYLSAAEKVSRLAVGTLPPSVAVDEYRVPNDFPQYQHVEGLPFGTRGGLAFPYNFPQDAVYQFTIKLMCGPPTGIGVCDGSGGFDDTHTMLLLVDVKRSSGGPWNRGRHGR